MASQAAKFHKGAGQSQVEDEQNVSKLSGNIPWKLQKHWDGAVLLQVEVLPSADGDCSHRVEVRAGSPSTHRQKRLSGSKFQKVLKVP